MGISSTLFCQDKFISGRVLNNYCEPLTGVSVCQRNSSNCVFSDINGEFHLLYDSEFSPTIILSSIGFHPVEIHGIDTITQPLTITMFEELVYYPISHPHPREFGVILFLKADFLPKDFSEFKPLLNDYNVDLMNLSSGFFSFEFAGTYKSYYAGLNWGYSHSRDYKHDSLDIKFNSNQYGLHFGYNLINSTRFIVTPKVAVAWNRHRLTNNDKDRKIPIEQYVAERDIDIRFNQLTGFAGLSLSYKIYNNILSGDYWTVGIYGGYSFKMNDNPWIYSKGNRLISDSKINMKNYNLGFYWAFH